MRPSSIACISKICALYKPRYETLATQTIALQHLIMLAPQSILLGNGRGIASVASSGLPAVTHTKTPSTSLSSTHTLQKDLISRRQCTSLPAVHAVLPLTHEDSNIVSGSIVEFRKNSSSRVGLIIGQAPKPAHWTVQDLLGNQCIVSEKNILFIYPGTDHDEDTLQSLSAERLPAEMKDASLIQLAWEVSECEAMYTVIEMADFLYGRVDVVACAAARSLLTSDSLYFKQIGRMPPVYSRRHPEEVEHLKNEAKRREECEVDWKSFIEAAELGTLTLSDWQQSSHAPKAVALEAYALGRTEGTAQRVLALNVLQRISEIPPTPALAARKLKSMGYWSKYAQLPLLAAGIHERFPEEVEQAASRILAHPPIDADASSRKDLRHQIVMTIDDLGTTEVDDALAIESLLDGRHRVWVHVADPSRWLTDTASGEDAKLLESEAAKRTRTLYLPTGSVRMFPASLAEGPFSLRLNTESHALSFGMVINADGSLDPDALEVMPSLIRPSRQLTYDAVDEMLIECTDEEEPDMFALHRVALLRRQYRQARGAIDIQLPESNVDVDQSGEVPRVNVTCLDQFESPGRQLVAEAMIVAGEAAGLLGAKLQVPLPYRGQAAPVLPPQEELHAVPAGPCRDALLRSSMTRSLTQAHAPVAHAGLGLDAYVQVTSPIRRYGDLLAHKQLKAALRGEKVPFDVVALKGELEALNEQTPILNKIEREVTQFWVTEYFRSILQKKPTSTWMATFLLWFKQESGLGRVLMDDLGLETMMKINSPVVPGVKIRVKISQLDASAGTWRVEEYVEQ